MRQPCKVIGCERPKLSGLHRCYWHHLASLPVVAQQLEAERRLSAHAGPRRMRVAASEWPPGERWCSGCQSYVPEFYTSGSRCRACGSAAAHESRVKAVYGLEPGDYEALMRYQAGRCYICNRETKKRLAVDHDHKTGEVRGLLCADNEWGCNRAIMGKIDANPDPHQMALRIVRYLETPPYDRVKKMRQ